MSFTLTQTANYGLTNFIVARVEFQNSELIRHTKSSNETKSIAIKILSNNIRPKLIHLYEILIALKAEAEENEKSFKPPSAPRQPYALASIINYDEKIESFLYTSKNVIRSILQLHNALYGTSFSEAGDLYNKKPTNFLKWSQDFFVPDQSAIEFYQNAIDQMNELAWARNAVEHPGGNSGRLVTENYSYNPNTGLQRPRLFREKDNVVVSDFGDAINFMHQAIENFVSITEDCVLLWAVQNIDSDSKIYIDRIPENARDPNCPIKWSVGYDLGMHAKSESQK